MREALSETGVPDALPLADAVLTIWPASISAWVTVRPIPVQAAAVVAPGSTLEKVHDSEGRDGSLTDKPVTVTLVLFLTENP